MIIDFHCHLYDKDVPSERYWEYMAKVASKLSKKPIEKVKNWFPQQWDISGDLLIEDMNEAGIDKSVVLPLDLGLAKGIGEALYSIEEENKLYAQAAANHPERIIAFVGVDPRRPEAIKLLEKGVNEWGAKGLKLMPSTGWYPDDKNFYPLYQKAQELQIPVLFHSGPELSPLLSKYSRPVYIDEVAVDFPDLKIIIAHAGYCWWKEAAKIASFKPNVYLDLAYWQPKIAKRSLEEFYQPLRAMLDTMGTPKVLFGSDWPTLRAVESVNNVAWVKAIKEPPDEVTEADITFSPEEKEEILGGNAQSILDME